MKNSLKLQILSVIFFLCGTSVMAQTNLSGRTYYNANIMAEDLNATSKDIDKKLADARVRAYAKIEQEKGRKPNEKEKAAIEKELQKAAEVSKAVKNGGITIKIKIDFTSDKDMVMDAESKVTEEVLKAAGVSWLKRKAMKAALSLAPSKIKGTYVVNGNMVIFDEDGEKDTLTLSPDGKYLYGKYDKKRNFKLTRTK